MSDDTMPDLTVEQRVRDSAIRAKGIKLSAGEVERLFSRHPSIAIEAHEYDMEFVDGPPPRLNGEHDEADDG